MIPDNDMQKLKSLSRATRGGTLDPQRLAERAYRMGSDSITLPLNLEELERTDLTRALEITNKHHGSFTSSGYRKGDGLSEGRPIWTDMTITSAVLQIPTFCWQTMFEIVTYAEQIHDGVEYALMGAFLRDLVRRGYLERKSVPKDAHRECRQLSRCTVVLR